MKDRIRTVKKKLNDAISQLCEVSWMFCKNPEKDFTRSRKLPFRKMISLLLSMEGGTLATEMLNHFGRFSEIASVPALVQQRGKINEAAFPSLFDLFVRSTDANKLYKGLRLIAADGSEIQIPKNPNDMASYYPGTNGQAPYNLLHLSAMYDLLQRTYTDAELRGKKIANSSLVM